MNKFPSGRKDDKEMPAFRSKTGLPWQKEKTSFGPGPGQYHQKSQNPKKLRDDMVAKEKKNEFGSHSDRVGWDRGLSHPFSDATKLENPGPDRYNTAQMSSGTRAVVNTVLPVNKRFPRVVNPNMVMALQESRGV